LEDTIICEILKTNTKGLQHMQKHTVLRIASIALFCWLYPLDLRPQQSSAASQSASAAALRDGQHDFDFEQGRWNIHLKRLAHPLTGSTSWVEFDGTSVTRKVWDGKAWLEEFETTGSSGKVEGVTLRLYHPDSRQWYLYWSNAKDGVLGVPTIGEFRNGVGEFYDQEPFHGRAILVRYVWSRITPNSAHFEQSFSDDGGKTWEVNWVTDQTRVRDESPAAR
jgi:hypothetical protein